MDFQQAQQTFLNLKNQFEHGGITAEEFETRVNEMTVTDTDGTLWQIGVKTGGWYRFDGQNWVEDTPPGLSPAPIQPPPVYTPPIPPVQPRSQSLTWLWVGGGLVALAICCVAIVVGVILVNRINPTTFVSVIPSATVSPPTVRSPTARPAVTQPVATQSQQAGPGFDSHTIFMDDFSNPNSGWDRVQKDYKITDYANGGYRIWVNKEKIDVWATPRKNFAGDVNIEVDATKVAGPDDNDFGVICRYQDSDNFYQFLISSDGYAGIARVKNGDQSFLSSDKMEPAAAIHQGAATNHIRVTCIGSALSLSVNGKQIASANDASFTSGDVGLIAGTFSNVGVDILFSNFSATSR
ncbi:MAG: hypothetical protein M1282_03860 [Chloroflexi bacterium]|nr:hypothetical protein [Chloroflexota bacterium]